jgi:hypothetical protein
MIHYQHDIILNNKTREKLYKVYTRALPLGRKFGSNCCLCDAYEDEMHCMVTCKHANDIWKWLSDVFNPSLPWFAKLYNLEFLFGYPFNLSVGKYELQIWKLFQAEIVRIIWYALGVATAILK